MGPLIFEPYLRPMVWGHRRLGTQFGKPLPPEGTFGETWEISAHRHHVSRVAEGPLKGALLTDLCHDHSRELFGDRVPPGNTFPLLIKILDCHDWLSIQVHPNDEQAPRLSQDKFGKTEAWVILSVEPGAKVFAGLKPDVTREVLERHLEAGTTDQCLHSFTPKPGDCIFLPAGTVHAVGGGIVMAEVQQSSDATFRLFDWNRLGSDGKPRQLHIRESLESINWDAGPTGPVQPENLDGTNKCLVQCPYFVLDSYRLEKPLPLQERKELTIWMALDGDADLTGGNYSRRLRKGETVLIPASAHDLTWSPAQPTGVTLLRVALP